MGRTWPLLWLAIDIRTNPAINSKGAADQEDGGVRCLGMLPAYVVTGGPLVLYGLPLPSWDDRIHNHRFPRHSKDST